MPLDDRAEAAVAGRLLDEPERRSPEEDRVPAARVVVDRHHDRAARPGWRVEQGPDRLDSDQRLVAQGDEDGAHASIHCLEPDL
jgi:hypothetical protein